MFSNFEAICIQDVHWLYKRSNYDWITKRLIRCRRPANTYLVKNRSKKLTKIHGKFQNLLISEQNSLKLHQIQQKQIVSISINRQIHMLAQTDEYL